MPNTRAAGVEDVEAIGIRMTEHVIAEVTAALNAKVDQAFAEVQAALAEVQATLVEHDGRLTGQDRRLGELAATVRVAAATVTKMVADLAAEPTRPPTPGTPLPRPAALDAACAAAEDGGPQRVKVIVDGRAVTQHVQAGDDPAQVWDDICASVTAHSEAVAWRN